MVLYVAFAQVGETVYTPGCFVEQICEGNNVISSNDLTCDENAYCGLDENGLYGCHCRAGYFGDGTVCTGKFSININSLFVRIVSRM